MYLRRLTITDGDGGVIRSIEFHQGLNLIVDETPSSDARKTGNSVGKTTVLKLIDYCLGGRSRDIYQDHEDTRNEYKLVKDYLTKRRVLISLVLKDDLCSSASREVLIERNFLSRKDKIQRIDNVRLTDSEFEEGLTNLLFPGHYGKKPTFEQIVAHNIRYTDIRVNNTLKYLNAFTRDVEYETLYLFLFGCRFDQADARLQLLSQIDLEMKFKRRLEAVQTKSAYETSLALLHSEIERLERRKDSLGVSPDFSADLNKLNSLKYQINVASSDVGKLELRLALIDEALRELRSSTSNIDVLQLKMLYQEAKANVTSIQKTFEELNEFHNRMIDSKLHFLEQDLPQIKSQIETRRAELNKLLAEESALSEQVIHGESFEVLEDVISGLNAKYQQKGEFEAILRQLSDVEESLSVLEKDLSAIDEDLFSEELEARIKNQINKFNVHFSAVSFELYEEKYAIKVDTKIAKGRRIHQFSAFNTNFSAGKKQGEISCFDIAYTLFADEEAIPCMHFLLNDKKELMHGNQLQKIGNLVNAKGIQFVASILRDKLPPEIANESNVIVMLSQDDKLFRIE